MGRPWYAFYPADYGRDTGHLTLVEHGAYRALMDHYYAAAAPLPADVGRLLRLCRAKKPAEQAAVRFVLREFFVESEDGFRHRRIDAEIEKALVVSAKCSAAAKKGNAQRSPKSRVPALQAGADGPPSQSQPQSQEINSSAPPAENRFEEFWNVFPRREAQGPARKEYAKALARGVTADVLIVAAAAYAARRRDQDFQFTKLPATWLEQECWLDDAGITPSGHVDAGPLRALWGGRAASLVDAIGAALFQAYFSGAMFEEPGRIRVASEFRRGLIERKFGAVLARIYGEFTVEAGA